MVTIDVRTRYEGDAIDLDPSTFIDEQMPALDDERFTAAARGIDVLGLPPLTLDVDGEPLTFTGTDGRLTVQRGPGDGLVVRVDRAAFSDLMQNVASTFWLDMTGRADLRQGSKDAFVEWESVLRCLLDGRPVYEPGSVDLRDRVGSPLDLRTAFHLDDDPDDVGHFLAEAGYLHLVDVFTEAEMAAVSADLDAAMASAERDDGASWWARTADGGWHPARILGFNQHSAALRELLKSERFRAIGTFTDDEMVQRDPDRGDSAEGLFKKVGVVEGISDVSWHRDCSPGGHARTCAGLVVGISITGAGPKNGELGVIAGSRRANTPPLGVEGLDLPRIAVPTNTGDVTVHCSCTLHMSRPPVSAERRVVYTGFGQAARPGDHRAPIDPEEARRQRAAQNDHVRRQQKVGAATERMGSHEL